MNKIFILSIVCLLLISCSKPFDGAIQKEIDEINENAPIQVDEITFLNSGYMNGDNIIFKYSVVTDGDDALFKTTDFQRLQTIALVDLYCLSPDTKIFRDYNKSITYSYYSNFGGFLTDITIFPSDCY